MLCFSLMTNDTASILLVSFDECLVCDLPYSTANHDIIMVKVNYNNKIEHTIKTVPENGHKSLYTILF